MNVKVIPAKLQRFDHSLDCHEKESISTYLCLSHGFRNRLPKNIDEQIGYYLDNEEARNLKVGSILSDGTAVTWIGEIEEL